MESTKIISIVQQHGENDYSLWYPDIPADDPMLNAFMTKHADSGCSIRGTAEDICSELTESLHIDAYKRAHVLMYNEPKSGYVGVDVFATYQGARHQFLSLLDDAKSEHADDVGWIEELICSDGDDDSLYFRDKDGYEVVYCQELIQNNESEADTCGRT